MLHIVQPIYKWSLSWNSKFSGIERGGGGASGAGTGMAIYTKENILNAVLVK